MTMDQDRTPNALAVAAGEVALAAAERAAAAEADRRLDPDIVKGVVAAGFPRHFVPPRWGGPAGTFTQLNPAVSAVGAGCTATAWCASLAAHVSRFAAHLPAEGLDEVWGDGPDTFMVASLTPLGTAEPVAGGYRLRGTWPFVSAVEFADYALLAATVPGAGPRVLAVPRGSWTVEDAWRNVGMAATGSNPVTVDGVVVPEARTVSRDDLFRGRAVASDAPCHAVPMQATTMMFAGPALGAAKGSLASWLAYVTPKIRRAAADPTPALPGMPTFNRAAYDLVLARSAADIDAAELLLDRAAATADQGGSITTVEVMRNWRDCAVATETLVGVVNRLFKGVGTTGQALTNPVQRFWRDANSIAGHQGLQVESAATAYSHQVITV
jgi:alkylation response protein AidB-like acyl-CoA dehydrogenase